MNQPLSLLHLIRIGGPAMWIILVFSVLSLTVILERLFTLWGFQRRAAELNSELLKRLYQGERDQARQLAERAVAPLCEVYRVALEAFSSQNRLSVEHRVQKIDRERQRLNFFLRRRLWVLGTIGVSAPFVGLFGTVVGIMRAFRDMAASGQGGFAVVADGIAEALVTTAGGILVAVIAVIAYNAFQTRTAQIVFELKLQVADLVATLTDGGNADGRAESP